MKIILRANGNKQIGLGHMYRAFALMHILQAKYDAVLLIKSDTLSEIIPSDLNYQYIPADQDEVFFIQQNFDPDLYVLLADGYDFDAAYQKKIKSLGFKFIYIDDKIDQHYYADLIFNHCPGIDAKEYIKEEYTKLCLGPNYSLLRPAFYKEIKSPSEKKRTENVLVCYGGADTLNLTLKTCQALLTCGYSNIEVIVGAAYDVKGLIQICEQNKNIHIHQNVNEEKMATLLRSADFGLVSASTILFEALAMELDVLSGYYVENQKRIHDGFKEMNAILPLGNIEAFGALDFVQSIQSFQRERTSLNKQVFHPDIKDNIINEIEFLCRV